MNGIPIKSTWKQLRMVVIVLFFLTFLALAYSVMQSGLGYMYDADEVARVQEAYLIATGHAPFTSYYTIYSPIFPILLLPIFFLKGFTFQAIDTARLVMTVLFFVRVGFLATFVSLIFGKRTAALFAVLFLLDPFTVFSSMQVRADNLMMLVLSLGLLALAHGVLKDSRRIVALAGGLLMLAFCIMVKSFPTLLAVSGIFLIWSWRRRMQRMSLAFIAGAGAVALLYVTPFLVTGSLGAMIQQSILDPGLIHSTVDYPTNLGFFYGPGNWYVYGIGGKPLNWVYAWVLPVMGFAGAYTMIGAFLQKQGNERKSLIGVSLAIALVVQWGLLFKLSTVFIQYYIPVMWLFAVCAAYAIDRLLEALSAYRLWREGAIGVFFVVYILLVKESYQANISRSKLGSGDYITLMNRIWQYVPPDAPVFPLTLFRPPAYPLAEGYFAGVHSGLLSRYPPVETYLERNTVPFVNASDYAIGYLPSATQLYIRDHYVKVEGGLDLMVRKEVAESIKR